MKNSTTGTDHLQNRIQELLDKHGIKRRVLGAMCDVTDTTIDNWARNDTQPNTLQLFVIAKLFGVKSINGLVKKKPTPKR